MGPQEHGQLEVGKHHGGVGAPAIDGARLAQRPARGAALVVYLFELRMQLLVVKTVLFGIRTDAAIAREHDVALVHLLELACDVSRGALQGPGSGLAGVEKEDDKVTMSLPPLHSFIPSLRRRGKRGGCNNNIIQYTIQIFPNINVCISQHLNP